MNCKMNKKVNLRQSVFLCLCSIIVFASCTRGINIETIEAMSEGAAKDSAMLYYYLGLKPGDRVRVEKSTKPGYDAARDANLPLYLTTSPEIKRDKNLKVLNQVCQVFRGDTLQIAGEYGQRAWTKEFMQKQNYSRSVKVRAVKNGKIAGEGWFYADGLLPLQHNWTIIFYQPGDVLALLFVFGGIILVIFLLWKLVYWLVVDKIRKKDCFWQGKKIYFKAVYLIMSILAGLMIFYVDYNDELVNSLKFNSNFFAHFPEYPFLLKLLPAAALLWVASTVGMLWEMIKKFRTLWLIIYFPGIWSIGFLLVALVFVASWLIYIILPTIVVFVIMIFAGKADDATGGLISKGGGGSKKRHGGFVGYNVKGEEIGDADRKDYPNVIKIP